MIQPEEAQAAELWCPAFKQNTSRTSKFLALLTKRDPKDFLRYLRPMPGDNGLDRELWSLN